jgi:hypothetical protein
MFLDIEGVNLFVQMLQSSDDSLSNTFKDDFINVIDISFPNRRLLVNVNFGMYFSHQLMDLVTIFFHILHFLGEYTLLLGIVVIHSHSSVLSLQHFNVDIVQTDFDFRNSFLHDLDHFEGRIDMFFSLFDKIGDIFGFPLQFVQSRGQSLIHLLNTVLN